MTLNATLVETDEAAFIPGVQAITVIAQPSVGEEAFTPPAAPYPKFITPYTPPEEFFLQKSVPEEKLLVVDIETTGLYPWESRVTFIGALDPEDPTKTFIFFYLDEEKTLREFIDFYTAGKYTGIIGYNLSFDFRFLFTHCMRYMIPCNAFVKADLRDVMQVMKQVKESFVFGQQKAGTLDQWAKYLYGESKYLDSELMLKLWEDKEYDEIEKHVTQDVFLTYKMWAHIQTVKQVP